MQKNIVPSEGFDNTEHSLINFYLEYDKTWHQLELHLLRSGQNSYNDEPFEFFHPIPHFNRIFILKSGAIRLQCSESEILMEKDKIYLIPINQSFTAYYDLGTVLYFCHFKANDVTGLDFFRDIKGFPSLKSGNMLSTDIIENIECESIERYLRWQGALNHCILLFLAEHLEFVQRWNSISDRYIHLINHIQKNCHPYLTLDELAQWSHTTKYALSKGFKRNTGMSVKKFIHEILIKKAKEILATTEMNVQETAFELGYKDPYYFQRFFKQNTGETPLHFKKSCNNSY